MTARSGDRERVHVVLKKPCPHCGGPRVWTVWPAFRLEVVTCSCDSREPTAEPLYLDPPGLLA